ncbi:hypothetical protein CHS0354_012468 [Potamilus streckersoni]|uniref:Mammalian ependymin-related protein 1 n=1 Tax=Potamilus streckersoni TaxID=2493646 RepID=A0AAE0S0A9_9BIVA|nr:hypothetical protein CHS0354_012468 [Potamilus streckersoni]
MLMVVVFLMGVGTILAQQPKRCDTPKAWQGQMRTLNFTSNKVDRFIVVYDEANERKLFVEQQIEVVPGRSFYEYLILNRENIMYTVDLRKNICTKSVPNPWRSIGIPENATFEFEYNLGGPNEGFTAQEWSDRIEFEKITSWIGVFSVEYCYPVREILLQSGGIDFSNVRDFYNVVEGIPDPNNFIPPKACDNAMWAQPHDRYLKFLI